MSQEAKENLCECLNNTLVVILQFSSNVNGHVSSDCV